MAHTITLIPGDGIGPEVSSAVVRIIEAAGASVQWETHYAGAQALEKFGSTLPDDLLESIKRNRVALKGPITTPVGKGFTSVNVGLRKALDLYANLSPVRALPNVPARYPELDLVVVRENTEGLFLDCFRKVAADYPEIEADDKIVDNACMQLVMRPEQFDIMLLENLYGDIVSDLCAGLIGGRRPLPRAQHRAHRG